MPGLMGAPAPLVRLLAGAALPTALPLVMASLLCVLSSLVVVLPHALLLVGLRCLWFRPVCVLNALLAVGLAPFLFESTLVSQCRLYAEAPGSLTLNDGSPRPVRHLFALLAAGHAPRFRESTLVSQCRRYA